MHNRHVAVTLDAIAEIARIHAWNNRANFPAVAIPSIEAVEKGEKTISLINACQINESVTQGYSSRKIYWQIDQIVRLVKPDPVKQRHQHLVREPVRDVPHDHGGAIALTAHGTLLEE